MPSSGSQGYNALPPIPSYEESIALQPPRSPIDDRSQNDIEQQSLLRNGASGSSGRRPGVYRQPTEETDDESEFDLDDLSTDSEEVRREMQEFEIEEPDSAAYRWGKRIGQWRWKWMLRMPSIRLPRLGRHSDSPNAESSMAATRATEEGQQGEGASSESAMRTQWFGNRLPSHLQLPEINTTAVFILIARVVALTLLLGFFYILFLSDMFSGMTRRMESRAFPLEMIKTHIQENIKPERLRATQREFTSFAHMAGTEGDFSLAEDIEKMLRGYGLEEVSISEYYVFMNYPSKSTRAVRLLGEDKKSAKWTAKLEEPELGGEKAGHQTFVFHGYSKSGTVKGPLIYANYGSRSDFELLQNMGIQTEGSIALMRYHGTQPHLGLKVKAAQEAGCVGAIVYTDPEDLGFVQAKTAPEGRSMPSDGVQRDSAALSSWVLGDPLTPGWESTKDLPRLAPDESPGLVKIPSLPLSALDAKVLLNHITGKGKAVEKTWRGSVPSVEYWTGDEKSPFVELVNENDEVEKQPIWNVHAKIVGVEQHHKAVIIGSHRDAWATGATSPGSGTAIFLEIARVYGILLKNGWRPRRTIIFASWDATTYNMVGSTEFVEEHLKSLREDGYAYINLDKAVAGDVFRAHGSPVFDLPLMHVMKRIGDPYYNATLYQLWHENGLMIQGPSSIAQGDQVPFQNIAGMSSLDLGFGGTEMDIYPRHSSYDNFHWMDNVGDPRWVYHKLLGQVAGLLLLELAENPVLPFDIRGYAIAIQLWVADLKGWADEKGASDALKNGKFEGFDSMVSAATSLEAVSKTFEAWYVSWDSTVQSAGRYESTSLGGKRYHYNDQMADFETALLDLEKDGGVSDAFLLLYENQSKEIIKSTDK